MTDPPLAAPDLRELATLLRSDAERAVVGRWLEAVPRLRRSDFIVVAEYASDRDADQTDVHIAGELDAPRARGKR